MDIESIKTFMVLAHTKNYTRTANQLFVAQSTVTNRIHELEKELGFRLFIRTNRSVELTPKGEQFRLYAEKLIDLTDTALAEISASQKYDHYLRIGCADSIYEGHLAGLILKHRKSHPKDYLKISIGLTDHLPPAGTDTERYAGRGLHLPAFKKEFIKLQTIQAGYAGACNRYTK